MLNRGTVFGFGGVAASYVGWHGLVRSLAAMGVAGEAILSKGQDRDVGWLPAVCDGPRLAKLHRPTRIGTLPALLFSSQRINEKRKAPGD